MQFPGDCQRLARNRLLLGKFSLAAQGDCQPVISDDGARGFFTVYLAVDVQGPTKQGFGLFVLAQ